MGTPIAFTGEYEGRYVSTTFSRASVAQNLVQNLSSTYQWWNGVDISNQYLIYSDTYSQGQAAYGSSRPTAWTTPDLTDAALLALINTLPDRVGYPGFTDIDIALNWMQGTNKYYLLKSGYENIVTSGLQINFDVAWYNSYSGTTSIFNINTSAGAGSLINGTSFLQYNGGVLNLDGTDDYVSFNIPNLTTTATIEMWCRPTSISGGDMFFGFLGYDIYTAGGNIGFNTGNGDVYGISSSTVGALGLENNWNHYVFEFRTDVSYTNNKIYINGVSFPLSQQLGGPTSQSFGNGDAYIGTWGYGGYNMAMHLGVFRAYNRSLTADEVRHNYNVQKVRFGHTNMVTSGLTVNYDPSNPISYPASGTNFYNLGSGQLNATIYNSPTFTTNNFGYFTFDGADDYIQSNEVVDLSNLNQGTLEIWMKKNGAWTAGYEKCIALSDGIASNLPFMISQAPGGSSFYCYLITTDNGGSGYDFTPVPSLNVWNHMVASYNGSTLKLYQNGIETNSYSASGNFGSILNTRLILGWSYFGEYWEGDLSIGSFYKRSLSSSEIQQNYYANAWKYGKGISRYGLVMYNEPGNYASYPGSNIIWKDLSGSGNNMTLYNGPTYNSSYGGVIQMDSTDDYARVTNPNIVLGTNPRTAILWFYATSSVYGCIFGYGNSPSTPTYGSMELWNYANPLSMHFAGGSISSGVNLSSNLNKWLMCALRFDGTTASVTIVDNGTLYTGSSAVPLNTQVTNYSINKSAYAAEGAGFAGYVGISATYLRHFSDSEVTSFYNETKGRYGL
jgi:hypothetical protein